MDQNFSIALSTTSTRFNNNRLGYYGMVMVEKEWVVVSSSVGQRPHFFGSAWSRYLVLNLTWKFSPVYSLMSPFSPSLSGNRDCHWMQPCKCLHSCWHFPACIMLSSYNSMLCMLNMELHQWVWDPNSPKQPKSLIFVNYSSVKSSGLNWFDHKKKKISTQGPLSRFFWSFRPHDIPAHCIHLGLLSVR